MTEESETGESEFTLPWREALSRFSFLASLPSAEPPIAEVTVTTRARAGGAHFLLRFGRKEEQHSEEQQAGASGSLGYTLLARRTQTWSARAIVRPAQLVGGPPVGDDPDPRKVTELSRPEVLEPLAEASAWLQVEGPWRVLGVESGSDAVARITALGEVIFPRIAEPDEFAGGLEWNI